MSCAGERDAHLCTQAALQRCEPRLRLPCVGLGIGQQLRELRDAC